MDRLTEADRKWLLTAEYGGTGGKQIESGLCVEEPDIEIGAGVSSKGIYNSYLWAINPHHTNTTTAISRRMQTDKSGQTGPRSTREQEHQQQRNGGGGRFRQPDRRDDNPNNITVPPPVPGFGFQFPMLGQNGMPIFPPGFVMPGMPGQTPPQPPPPGAS
jgi:protein NRD1